MLTAALIFVLSFAAMIQFVVLHWRATMFRVASSLSTSTAEGSSKLLYDKDFSQVAAFRKLCPDLGGSASALRSVHFYHRFLKAVSALASPDWVKREMDLCARYAAAVLMQQVARNQSLAAEARSY